MPRRLTIPDEHVALVLPNQLADELNSLLVNIRLRTANAAARVNRHNATADVELKPLDQEQWAQRNIAGDVMLALLEAREA